MIESTAAGNPSRESVASMIDKLTGQLFDACSFPLSLLEHGRLSIVPHSSSVVLLRAHVHGTDTPPITPIAPFCNCECNRV